MSENLAISIKNKFDYECGHFTYDRLLELTTWWILNESNNFNSDELELKISDALSLIVFWDSLKPETFNINWKGVEYDRKQTRSDLLQILITAMSQLKSRNQRYLVFDDEKPALLHIESRIDGQDIKCKLSQKISFFLLKK